MKNGILISLIASLVLNPLFAESIFVDSSHQSQSQEVKESQKEVLQENLDYLFDTNYPLDDYLYKQKPKPKYLDKDFAQREDPNALNQDNVNTDNAMINKAEILKREIEAKEQISTAKKVVEDSKNAQKSISQPKPPKPLTREQKLNAMLRDSILAERGNQETYFSSSGRQWGVDRFSNQENIDTATNEHNLLRMIRAGRLIPATLTTAISSDLAGIVSAQIEEDIYMPQWEEQ
ncbi:hypothetical protein [Helicobacter sp. MIT 11-5569]|uniref:hypothetical protein n=1 Tax=Helicobacter sp. MIT 11-5569 TaxID=1548151 RepID=UPI000AACD80A|nr:hypothetical protein [Helicobacter sp. MIT 11-5569]